MDKEGHVTAEAGKTGTFWQKIKYKGKETEQGKAERKWYKEENEMQQAREHCN